MSTKAPSVVLVANPEVIHVGGHLLTAAKALNVRVEILDSRQAFEGPRWRQKLEWWLRGHRPARLTSFSARVVDVVRRTQPTHVITTGLAPLDAVSLREIGRLGARRLNYLTDDPWNPAHRAPWFMDALTNYDHVFSPRRANINELAAIGGPSVTYLPFAYAPDQHFPEPPVGDDERAQYAADVVFAGGADAERVAIVRPFLEAGLQVALYGGYWDRYAETRAFARGHADPRRLRKAIGGAHVSLCLVRRANRDGHSMRTFEVPAMGGCMVIEDTDEHRAFFGAPGDAVIYANTTSEMVDAARALVNDPDRRQRLAGRAHRLIADGPFTYADRLRSMLEAA
jgi:spore maturation protein CgeB